jgi:hypothetical protein
MKNFQALAIGIIFLSACTVAHSQFRFDLLAGIAPGSHPIMAGLIVNRHLPSDEFVLNMTEVKPQIFGGMRVNLELTSPFFTEVGLTYTRKTMLYDVDYTYIFESRLATHQMKETEHQLLVPVSIGVSLGSFDVTSGFRGILTLSKETELSQLEGFHSKTSSIHWGWHTGVRYGINRAMVGVEYQGCFNRVGYGSFINGQSLELRNVPGHFVFTLQYSL